MDRTPVIRSLRQNVLKPDMTAASFSFVEVGPCLKEAVGTLRAVLHISRSWDVIDEV